MGDRVLFAQRLREHVGLFAALMGVVALVSGLTVGVLGFLGHSADEGVRAGLATRTGAALALQASLGLDSDAERQDAEVRAAIARSMQGIPVDVVRTVDSRADVVEIVDGTPGVTLRTLVLSVADLPTVATIVAGDWPTSADHVSVQVFAAERLGIEPGDVLKLGDATVTVSGTWQVDDATDPRWLGDTTITEGISDVVFGPIVVDETLWPQLNTDPRARWTLVPDGTRLNAADLVTIVAAWADVESAWKDEVSSQLFTLERRGGFTQSALELGTRVDGQQVIQPVALLLLAAVALVTLAELGRLLTTTRAPEIALLWSRGASAFDIGRAIAAETALAAGTGAVGGTAGALVILGLMAGPDAPRAAGAAVWIAPLAITVGAVLVVAGGALRSALRNTSRDPSDAGGRARRLAGPGVVVLTTAAAALSVWQLRLYGSPLTPTADGGTDVDPIGVLAPALSLVALVLLALVLFPRVSQANESATAKAPAVRILAARTLARRLQLVAAPIVVVAVAAATLVVASGYATTWRESFERTSELHTGAAIQVSTGAPGLTTATITSISGVPGVSGIAPVDLETFQIGNVTGSIVGATPATVARLATTANGSFDRNAVAEAITAEVPGPLLPEGTSALTLTTSQGGFAEQPLLSLQVMDGYGMLQTVPFATGIDEGVDSALAAPGVVLESFSYTVDLPSILRDALGPLRILAIDVAVGEGAVAPEGTGEFTLSELSATAGGNTVPVTLDGFWLPESPVLQFDPPTANYKGLGFTSGSNTRNIRMTPTFDGALTDSGTAPVVISQQLADRFSLRVGDPISVTLDDASDALRCTVAQVIPAIPGAAFESAVLIDRAVVLHYLVRTQDASTLSREFWIDTDSPQTVVEALRNELPANARTQIAGDPAGRIVLGSASFALWLGALGCMILAVITVVAVVRAQLRSRRLEVVVLRAIGLSSRQQSAVRRRELGLVLGYGVAAGLIAGAAVTALTVPQLARAAVVDPYSAVPTALGFDLVGLAVGLAALILALSVIVTVYTSRVAVQARTAIGAEETL